MSQAPALILRRTTRVGPKKMRASSDCERATQQCERDNYFPAARRRAFISLGSEALLSHTRAAPGSVRSQSLSTASICVLRLFSSPMDIAHCTAVWGSDCDMRCVNEAIAASRESPLGNVFSHAPALAESVWL